MTTTPATTSASPSTSNDSPIQDNNGASEMSIDQQPQTHSSPNQHQSSSSPPSSSSTSSSSSSPDKQRHQQQKLQPQQQSSTKQQTQTNTIEQKRPMNAFLLFCKKQRSLVREKYPNLENRGITRILGDWWSKLDKEQKSKFTDLARQHKEAFMEANPDFKWCKTPMTSNNNNNSNSNSNANDCYSSNNRSAQQSSISPASTDLHQSNSRDTFTNNKHHHEAPKPPKKRYLERNEPVYSKNNSGANDDSHSNANDHIVPYMQLDQGTLGRVIEKALSEKSNNSPTGLNMCKDSNRNPPLNNLTSSVSLEPSPFTTSAPTTNSTSVYTNGDDEPVDFSMKMTFRATNQLIIDNVIEKAYSGSVDIAGGTSRSAGSGNVHSQLGSSVRRVNTEDT